MRNRLSIDQMADLIMTLIGEITPVGQDSLDEVRFEHLCYLQSVVGILLDEIQWLLPSATSYEYSVKKIGAQAERWLREERDLITDWLEENDG